MEILYKDAELWVVNDGCPGLKIYDATLERIDMINFGAFYDDMPGYPKSATEAAKSAINRHRAAKEKLI